MSVELHPVQEDLVKVVKARIAEAREGLHTKLCTQWDKRYSYYRSYSRSRNEMRGLDRRDRDVYLNDMQSTWGSDLFIPYCYSTIETILPRLLANNPRMLIRPSERRAEESVENMKFTIDAQQAQITYPLTLQTIAKDGLIYGLGVGKTFWRREQSTAKRIARGIANEWIEKQHTCVSFDDPDVEAIDPRDFIWDPMAQDMKYMRWAVHRTWRDTAYVLYKINTGQWDGVPDLTADDLKGANKTNEYKASLDGRMAARGIQQNDLRSNDVHEIWEYHGQGMVITIVDGLWPVHVAENPYWHGELPFQIFRPTEITHELVGMSAIEVLMDLQDEMNTLRMQRRDNATIALQKPFLYNETMFDSADLQLGPGIGLPTTGDVNEAIRPIEFGDIPYSGYREEQNLQADIERAVGISDTLAGSDSGSSNQTATGAQLVYQSANERIKNMTFRMEQELITPQARQFLRLNQQYIASAREMRLPVHDPSDPERRYLWFDVGPEELSGEMQIEAIGGSTAADNVPQMRADGEALMSMLGQDPTVNRRKLVAYVLKNFDIKNADEYLAPEQPMLPADALNVVGNALAQEGVPQELIQQAIDQAMEQSQAPQPLPQAA